MRNPVEITMKSAASIAKWRIKEILSADQTISAMERFAMSSSMADGGGVDKIAKILYDLGLKITIDKNNPEHKAWIDNNSVRLDTQ